MLSFNISYWDLIKFLYFADTTEREDREWKQGPKTGWKEGDFMDLSIILRIDEPMRSGYSDKIMKSLSSVYNTLHPCQHFC